MHEQNKITKEIVVYAEGGMNLGLGNIYRSLSLIKAIIEKVDVIPIFLTTSDNIVCDLIESENIIFFRFNSRKDVLIYIKSINPVLTIIDILNISCSFVEEIKKNTTSKICIFGNDNESNKYSDLVVNAIIGTQCENKREIDQYGTIWLKGPKYIVLRDEFLQLPNTYMYKNNLSNVLLLFGGSDQANYSCRLLKLLLQEERNIKITLITGPSYLYIADLEKIIGYNRVRHIRTTTQVSKYLMETDFFITSPGTSFFEALYIGIPSISIFQNESQKRYLEDSLIHMILKRFQ
jgi:spore coat polysaccharide biosynthesis predicted glycosyltransferase SpsG